MKTKPQKVSQLFLGDNPKTLSTIYIASNPKF